ncbi:putative anthocyanin 6''-O-malonyltransferase [Helianthus annuus]|uniref:Anthocyanin 6''-O-malonyltransferase n=1 Tax=Helianthus annuus TaxID=4232 RepID=A0A251T414_HELAN|nr:putative anthocyanin 6''-O-malonyltransferase [Helianthus annuus]KAJ0494003.1 putative anthocyanin 6''-O-malonyltransferase [Helianthus annuus]KAJ0675547.1 putative anthocyanin 6''-O-malonyltransferase [Helianthus annuus]KAJ0678827.1 putative anthocyanin 6''-O-malonyltransferase [Helianthus annuus]KAJ0863323.1 putative anthocyanin 6''-O-malonyltransferase [Helianthus annuus]
MLNVLEKCRISPPPAAIGDRSLPLTFFDSAWLLFFPIHQIFFYEFPHPTSYFLETIVPKLKHSLSITLQHFFPFAGNLIVFPNPNRSPNGKRPEIRHVEGDAVALTFAECDLDFDDLIGNHPRECHKFYPLVPLLGQPSKVSNHVTIPLFSVQVTLFPNKGISIGLTNHHCLCDATTRFNFLNAWTSIAKHGTDELFIASGSLPFYERVIKYPESLDEICCNQPGIETIDEEYKLPQLVGDTDKARATLVLTQAHINRLKKWISVQLPTLEYVSSFSVACAYVWSCIAKSRARIGGQAGDDDLERFLCVVDWRSRIHPPLPQTYFGNCVGPCLCTPTKSTLLASNTGFRTAAEVFGKALSETIKNKDALMKDAETWLEKAYEPVPTIGVSGTPKYKVYDVDFGWGKAKKHETPSIDYNGSISCRSLSGG